MIQNDALCEVCCRQHGRIFETCNTGCKIRDLFETITKERDAAVADLETMAKHSDEPCYWCANYPDVKLTRCMMCDDEEYNGNFEWRGLSLESKTNDKELKE